MLRIQQVQKPDPPTHTSLCWRAADIRAKGTAPAARGGMAVDA